MSKFPPPLKLDKSASFSFQGFVIILRFKISKGQRVIKRLTEQKLKNVF